MDRLRSPENLDLIDSPFTREWKREVQNSHVPIDFAAQEGILAFYLQEKYPELMKGEVPDLAKAPPEVVRAFARSIGLEDNADRQTVQFGADYVFATAASKFAIEKGPNAVMSVTYMSPREESTSVATYDKVTKAAIDLVGKLTTLEQLAKRNPLTHLLGLSAFSRKIKEKYGGGYVGLGAKEQAEVIAQVEAHFAPEHYHQSPDFSSSLNQFLAADYPERTMETRIGWLKNILGKAQSLPDLAAWYLTVERTQTNVIDLFEPYKERLNTVVAPLFAPKELSAEEKLAEHERRARERGQPAYFDRAKNARREEKRRDLNP